MAWPCANIASPLVPKQVTVVKQQNVAAGNQQVAMVDGRAEVSADSDSELGTKQRCLTHVEFEDPFASADRRPPEPVEAPRLNGRRAALRLRQTALANQPWRYSTGPRTAAGKARSAANGRVTQKHSLSVREVRAVLAETCRLTDEMAELRCAAGAALD